MPVRVAFRDLVNLISFVIYTVVFVLVRRIPIPIVTYLLACYLVEDSSVNVVLNRVESPKHLENVRRRLEELGVNWVILVEIVLSEARNKFLLVSLELELGEELCEAQELDYLDDVCLHGEPFLCILVELVPCHSVFVPLLRCEAAAEFGHEPSPRTLLVSVLVLDSAVDFPDEVVVVQHLFL